MILQAESAAVDLRGADLDQLDQFLVEAGLCRELAERQQGLVDVGRLRLEAAYSLRACDMLFS